jgi:hypothetical protein
MLHIYKVFWYHIFNNYIWEVLAPITIVGISPQPHLLLASNTSVAFEKNSFNFWHIGKQFRAILYTRLRTLGGTRAFHAHLKLSSAYNRISHYNLLAYYEHLGWGDDFDNLCIMFFVLLPKQYIHSYSYINHGIFFP